MRMVMRLGALAMIAASFFVARGTAHDRVMILVLEGAPMAEVRALARAGHLPVLESSLAGGIGGEIVSAREVASTDALLRSLLEVRPLVGSDDGLRPSLAWDELEKRGRPYALIGVQGTVFVDEDRRVVLAGPDVASGFIGSNTGLILNKRTVTRGEVPWPYSTAKDVLAEAVRDLSRDRESSWITWTGDPAGEGREGVFRVQVLDRDTMFVTPIYTRYRRLPADSESLYVADDPARVITSSRTSEYLSGHVGRLSEARADAALHVAARTDWDLFVYVDRRLAVFERGADRSLDDMSAELTAAYVDLDQTFGELATIAGGRTVILVVGLDVVSRRDDEPLGWLSVANVVGDLSSWGPLAGSEVAATVSYLLGFGSRIDPRPVAAISTRFPVRGRARLFTGGGSFARNSSPATAAVLRAIVAKQHRSRAS
jgi:hypothetical protein